MKNTTELVGGTIGTALTAVGAGISVEEVQTILSIICTVLGIVITLITGVIIPLIKHFKKASEDGKITEEEIKEGVNIVVDGVKQIKDKVNK